MESWILLISFAALLTGVFVFKKLWLGALLAITIFLVFKIGFHASIDSVSIPLASGFLTSLELTLLLFGAYLFYNTLSSNNHFANFTKTTSTFSSKLSILIILCLFIGSFMEGIAGFGIPAMLIAPLLITLDFKPITSIVLPLAANTTAVTFGALGTPFKVGLGIYESEPTVLFTVLLNSLPALTLPFILAFLYSKTEQAKVNWIMEWKMLLGAGFCFVIPYSLIGLVSVEYPSVVAGIVGLITFVFFFIPKNESPSFVFWMNTFYPYFLFVLLLFVAKDFLSDYYWKINERSKPLSLYQPGIVFIITSIVYLFITQKKQFIFQLYNQSKETVFKIGKSIATIILLVCFAQLIQKEVSDFADSYYSELPQITQLVATPLIGIVGSFITGSATMSNLLLSSSVRTSIVSSNYLPILFALLHTGAAVGNAISFQNIVMVKSVVNQPISYGRVLMYNLFVVATYVLIVIFTSLIIVNI